MLRTKELSGLDTRDQRTVEGPNVDQRKCKSRVAFKMVQGTFQPNTDGYAREYSYELNPLHPNHLKYRTSKLRKYIQLSNPYFIIFMELI